MFEKRSIWERWHQGQHVSVNVGVFKDCIGVIQDASGAGEGRIDKTEVLELAFLLDGRIERVWLRAADCTPV